MFLNLLESLEDDIFVSATEPLRHPEVCTMCGDVRIVNVLKKGRVVYVQRIWHRKWLAENYNAKGNKLHSFF